VLAQVQAYLLDHWHSLPMGQPRPRELTISVRATGVGKLCGYLFAAGEAEPRWVVKLPRSPRDNERLAAEYDLVRHVRQQGGEFTRATVPGPLFTATVAGCFVAVERYLHGVQIDGPLARDPAQIDRFLDLAMGWLLRCQKEAGERPRPFGLSEIEEYVTRPVEQLARNAALTAAETAFLDDTVRRARDLAGLPLPLVFEHGDFRPANILLDGSAIQVLDWEFGTARNLPLFDVFSCLARVHDRSLGLDEIDGYLEDYLAAFEAVFFSGGEFASRTATYVTRACRELGVAAEWADVLLAMYLVNEANKYRAFLNRRAQTGYLFLLRSRHTALSPHYGEQLARQKYVWLLGHLALHKDQSVLGLGAHQMHLPEAALSKQEVQVG
jgi:Ser/Thr protein kinase RdoA (MazF antagonist)